MKNGFIFHEFEVLMKNYVEGPEDSYTDGPESILWYGEHAKDNNTKMNDLRSKVIDEHRWPTDEEYNLLEKYRGRLEKYTYGMRQCLGQYLYDVKTFEYVQQVLKEVEKNYFG